MDATSTERISVIFSRLGAEFLLSVCAHDRCSVIRKRPGIAAAASTCLRVSLAFLRVMMVSECFWDFARPGRRN